MYVYTCLAKRSYKLKERAGPRVKTIRFILAATLSRDDQNIIVLCTIRVWLNYRRGTVNICRFEREDLFMVDISWTISPWTRGFRFPRDRTRYGQLFAHKETSRLFEFFSQTDEFIITKSNYYILGIIIILLLIIIF